MSKYIYLNLYKANVDPLLIDFKAEIAEMKEIRQNAIIKNTEDYTCAIDKFTMHRIILPVYRDFAILSIRITDLSTNNIGFATCDFSAHTDENNFMYSVDHFFNVVNTTMTNAFNDVGVSSNIPYFRLQNNFLTDLYLPGGGSVSNFIGKYKIQVSLGMITVFRGYNYNNISDVFTNADTMYQMNLSDKGNNVIANSMNDPIHLSPISKIIVASSDIPVESELVASSSSSSNPNRSNQQILTDFNWPLASHNAIVNIEYNALSNGMYRLHDMGVSANFTTASLTFYYRTNASLELFPIKHLGNLDSKIVFIKK